MKGSAFRHPSEDNALLSSLERVSFRVSLATFGSWGPTRKILTQFGPRDQAVLRGQINRLIDQLFRQRLRNPDIALGVILRESLPTAAKVLSLDQFSIALDLATRLVLQRGFTLAGQPVRGAAYDVRDTLHGFSAGDRSGCQAPTACQTHAGARRSPTPSRPGATSLLGLFFNRRLMRTTKKCARMTNVI